MWPTRALPPRLHELLRLSFNLVLIRQNDKSECKVNEDDELIMLKLIVLNKYE